MTEDYTTGAVHIELTTINNEKHFLCLKGNIQKFVGLYQDMYFQTDDQIEEAIEKLDKESFRKNYKKVNMMLILSDEVSEQIEISVEQFLNGEIHVY